MISRICFIEIGSNAIRHYIARLYKDSFKVEERSRFPIRLGASVFKTGSISKELEHDLTCIFLKIYFKNTQLGIKTTYCIATSALRESANKNRIIDSIYKLSKIKIHPISGQSEAKLVHLSSVANGLSMNKNSLLIDMGGGSTEFTICKKGEILGMKSFPFGTLRYLKFHKKKNLEKIIKKNISEITNYLNSNFSDFSIQQVYGIGGNYRRIAKLNHSLLKNPVAQRVKRKHISKIYSKLQSLSYYDRIKYLGLRKDRADVLIPATYFINSFLKSININEVILPDMNLSDGALHLIVTHKNFRFKQNILKNLKSYI